MKKTTLLALLLLSSTFAHDTQFSESVAGLMHIEPDDQPEAGKASLAWFELTQKGGAVVTAKLCKCTLLVYSGEPSPRKKPVLTQALQDVQGKLATRINLPKAGEYTFYLDGRPQNGAKFGAFKLHFDVSAK